MIRRSVDLPQPDGLEQDDGRRSRQIDLREIDDVVEDTCPAAVADLPMKYSVAEHLRTSMRRRPCGFHGEYRLRDGGRSG